MHALEPQSGSCYLIPQQLGRAHGFLAHPGAWDRTACGLVMLKSLGKVGSTLFCRGHGPAGFEAVVARPTPLRSKGANAMLRGRGVTGTPWVKPPCPGSSDPGPKLPQRTMTLAQLLFTLLTVTSSWRGLHPQIRVLAGRKSETPRPGGPWGSWEGQMK